MEKMNASYYFSTAIVRHPRILSDLRGRAKTAACASLFGYMVSMLAASPAPYVSLLSTHLAHG